ncbi:coatomer subunit epsilon [Sarcoptes scabiei]|nr:coatomer subunit epsilon [Sarcoptes scabiei]
MDLKFSPKPSTEWTKLQTSVKCFNGDGGNGYEPYTENNSNRLVKLIIKSYLRDLLANPSIGDDELKDRLSRINEHVAKHPAMHQKYLWVGQKPPTINPDRIDEDQSRSESMMKMMMTMMKNNQSNQWPSVLSPMRKRNLAETEQLPSEESCQTEEKWEQIIDTHDLLDNKVKVIQEEDMQQFVFSYRCANSKGKCLGISPLYESECTERFGWMYMYYQQDDQPPKWGFVNAPHHCACKLRPKLFQKIDQQSINEI